MIVNWKGSGMLMVPIVDLKSGTSIPGKVGGEQLFRLMPGNNDVPFDLWQKMKPHLVDHLERGRISEIGRNEKGENGAVVGDTPLGGLHMKRQKIEVIEDTLDMRTLDKWKKENESDEDITRALNRQIEKVKNGGKTKDEIEELIKAGY